MRIHDDHMYHGSALIQIAEHPQFTAINSLTNHDTVVPTAYRINNDIAVYLKYASKPISIAKEYTFAFKESQLQELAEIAQAHPYTFLVLVCVEDREICCLGYMQLLELIERREKAKGSREHQYVVLVTVPKGKSLRVYINAPNVRSKYLGKELVIKRKAFPNALFGIVG
jgi:hypothetical protein